MSEDATVTTTAPAAPPKRPRGRETGGDMIRSLAVVLLIVFALWFFARPSPGVSKAIRPVNPGQELTDFRGLHPAAPEPVATPRGFVPTSSTLDGSGLRIGYVTPSQRYAEYAASTGPAAALVTRQSGRAPVVGTVDVGGTPWQQRQSGAVTSLVRTVGPVTVVVGGLRENASLAELLVLAAAVTTG